MQKFLPTLLLLALTLFYQVPAFADHPYGELNPTLHKQALSHLAFHSDVQKLHLAKLVTLKNVSAVAIVGVEWGDDLSLFAGENYHVYAFEPLSKFVEHLQKMVNSNPNWNVTLVPIAAGNKPTGTIELQYDNAAAKEVVQRGIVDDHVRERLAVMSVDVQGDELDVLEGSKALLEKYGVDSLWIEAIACNEKVAAILQMLDADYVMFDFVPWGMANSQETSEVPRSRDSFVYDADRPSAFGEFLDWMCRVKQAKYKWLQTDFLAVRRDIFTSQMLEQLESLQDLCGDGESRADCVLRRFISEEMKDVTVAKGMWTWPRRLYEIARGLFSLQVDEREEV